MEPTGGVAYKVVAGSTMLEDDAHTTLHAVRCTSSHFIYPHIAHKYRYLTLFASISTDNTKPASTDVTRGTFEVTATGQVAAHMHRKTASTATSFFQGEKTAADNEFVLIFNPITETFTLERLGSLSQLTFTPDTSAQPLVSKPAALTTVTNARKVAKATLARAQSLSRNAESIATKNAERAAKAAEKAAEKAEKDAEKEAKKNEREAKKVAKSGEDGAKQPQAKKAKTSVSAPASASSATEEGGEREEREAGGNDDDDVQLPQGVMDALGYNDDDGDDDNDAHEAASASAADAADDDVVGAGAGVDAANDDDDDDDARLDAVAPAAVPAPAHNDDDEWGGHSDDE